MDIVNVKNDLINLVLHIAPALGAALGGPAGGIVGTLIAHIFKADPANPQDVIKKIQNDPEGEFKLKTLEFEHIEDLSRLNVQASAIKVLSDIIAMD